MAQEAKKDVGSGPKGDPQDPTLSDHIEESVTSLYDERLQEDLDDIRGRLEAVGNAVRDNLFHAVKAASERDRRLANETIIKDRAVNEDLKDLDHMCHLFVVRHLPSAGHLRFVSSVLRLSVALERVGDYATTICRVTLQLTDDVPGSIKRDIELMGDQAVKCVEVAMDAFLRGDVEQAKVGLGLASQVSGSYKNAFGDLIAAGERDRRPIGDLFAFLLIFRLLNRSADQADNACELTIFAVTGERKETKRYRILFVDQTNTGLSKLAEVAAEAGYPEAGSYASAGVDPGDAFDDELQTFCAQRGISLDGVPRSIEDALDIRRHYHVIIGLSGDPAPHLEHVPFRTVVLEWDVKREDGEGVGELYRKLMGEISSLMTTLGVRDDE